MRYFDIPQGGFYNDEKGERQWRELKGADTESLAKIEELVKIGLAKECDKNNGARWGHGIFAVSKDGKKIKCIAADWDSSG